MQPYVRTKAEEIANSASHGIGAVAAIVFLPLLIYHAATNGSALSIAGCVLFCLTMLATYASSSLYHALPDGKAKDILLRLDHGSIFLLIAGTYAPFGLHKADFFSLTYFTVIWAIAVTGLVLKLLNRMQNVWISLVLYLVMGWMATTAVLPLFGDMSGIGKGWLIAGGAAYSTGVIFYAFGERIRFFHLAWHLFVLTGTVLHAVSVVIFVGNA